MHAMSDGTIEGLAAVLALASAPTEALADLARRVEAVPLLGATLCRVASEALARPVESVRLAVVLLGAEVVASHARRLAGHHEETRHRLPFDLRRPITMLEARAGDSEAG